MTVVSRGARAVESAGRSLIDKALEHGPPVDEFGEFNDAKTAARELASTKGHRLGRWRRKASAPNTAATAVCQSCAALAVVNTERGTASIGLAVTARCQRGRA